VDTRDELLAGTLDATDRIKEREDQLRRGGGGVGFFFSLPVGRLV